MRFWTLHNVFGANWEAYPEATCYQMLLTRPPVQEADIRVDVEFIRARYLVQREIVDAYKSDPEGIRISELVDIARKVEQDDKERVEYARVVGISVRTKWILLPTEEEQKEIRILNGIVLPNDDL